ncbi:MAG: hypothetical protein RLZZ500_511 [Bacteroidota bacterium]|jgi:hypothetical protein
MAQFLNTNGIASWIERIIDEAERELIILSPYMQLSDTIYHKLLNANEHGVETTLVYRENQITEFQKEKLKALDNLNLMHHSNLHAKCFYNEKYLLIASMNLYEYSINNNREMGVLFRRTDEDSSGWNDYKNGIDDDSIFQDAIAEIKNIISSSEIELESRETQTIGFEMDIMKTKYDLAVDKSFILNKYSKNRKFIPFQLRDEWFTICENYIDRVDVIFQGKKIILNLNFDEPRLLKIYDQLSTEEHENKHVVIDCFRMYWTYHKSSISLYSWDAHPVWQLPKDSETYYPSLFEGLNTLMKIIKSVIEVTKK